MKKRKMFRGKLAKIKKALKSEKIIQLEIDRKMWHLFSGLGVAVGYYFLPQMLALQILAIISAIVLIVMDTARKRKVFFFSAMIDRIEREGVEFPAIGSMHFVIGAMLAIFFLPKNAAVLGICLLSITDAFSTIFGKLRFVRGEKKIKIAGPKTLQGFLGGFIPTAIFLLAVVDSSVVAVLTALFASTVELFAPIDDNLLLPLTSGFFYWMLLHIFI